MVGLWRGLRRPREPFELDFYAWFVSPAESMRRPSRAAQSMTSIVPCCAMTGPNVRGIFDHDAVWCWVGDRSAWNVDPQTSIQVYDERSWVVNFGVLFVKTGREPPTIDPLFLGGYAASARLA